MRQNSGPRETAEQHVRDIRRATRKKYATEDKIRVVLSGLQWRVKSHPTMTTPAWPTISLNLPQTIETYGLASRVQL